MVGDWPTRDILGARDHGLHTVYARYGDQTLPYRELDAREAEAALQAEFVIDDLAQLLDVLAVLNGTAAAHAGAQAMKIVTARQMAAIDRETIAAGTPALALMERAGAAIVNEIYAGDWLGRRDRRSGGGGLRQGQQRRRRPGHRAAAGPARRGGERPAAVRRATTSPAPRAPTSSGCPAPRT